MLSLWAPGSYGYAVLAHQTIIDAVWETHLKPLLHRRFPKASEEELSAAQAYAYGGAIIQDLGYYPHGSPFFSDLAHYVRSGDFVAAMLRDSQDLYEYAFALGALSHYATDNDGHRLATNRAVPILYPKLQKKFGNVVTYEDDPLSHVKTEFGFDVLEVARQRYAPESYHDFIGFEVSQPLLERAFLETYGIELKSVLTNEDLVLNSYRRDVSKLLPEATRIAWSLKKKEIQAEEPSATRRKFLYNLSRASYEKEWGPNYDKPSRKEKFFASLYRLLPKFGPLRVLELKAPTPETEKMFEESFNASLEEYRRLLGEVRKGQLKLPNTNFDVGEATAGGKYKLNDDAHAKLLDQLAKGKFETTSPELKQEILAFFSSTDAPYAMKKDQKAWEKVQAELGELKAFDTPPSQKPEAKASQPGGMKVPAQ